MASTSLESMPCAYELSASSRSRCAFRRTSRARRQSASTTCETAHPKIILTPVSYLGASFARKACGPEVSDVSNRGIEMGFDSVVKLTDDVANTITQEDKSCASSALGVAAYV